MINQSLLPIIQHQGLAPGKLPCNLAQGRQIRSIRRAAEMSLIINHQVLPLRVSIKDFIKRRISTLRERKSKKTTRKRKKNSKNALSSPTLSPLVA
jgi:DNA recombination-dependent growth factor C